MAQCATWNIHPDKPSILVRNKIALIGNSIWYSTGHKTTYDKSDTGMIEYDTKLNKIVNIIDYPANIVPKGHKCCHDGDVSDDLKTVIETRRVRLNRDAEAQKYS